MTTSPPPQSPAPGNEPPDNGTTDPRGLIAVLSRDLFFGMRIRASLRPLGYIVTIKQDAASFTNTLLSEDQPASLGLIDFNQSVVWNDLADALNSPVPIVAFGPHKDIEGFRAARNAGVTRVVANGEFSRSLAQLVEKYVRSLRR